MTFKNGFRLWDDEFEREHFTPEEIAESNKWVEITSKIIDAKMTGLTQDEAAIKIFMENPDDAEFMLKDALYCEDPEEISHVQYWYNEAKARSKNSIPNMDYWNGVTNNAKLAVQDGHNLRQILSRLNDAVGIVKAAMV